MAERQLPKLNVAGSIPVSRSIRFNSSDYKTAESSNLVVQTIRGYRRSCGLFCAVLPISSPNRVFAQANQTLVKFDESFRL